ncbi:MAG: nitroreductase family protein [Saprospiraceae bacterium]|nr:nitroreductase family protein [Saprospiraceae bacterium]
MTFEEVVNHRRSIRYYKDLPIDPVKVKHCIELASLAPNSSNMQLWEFHHITDPVIVKQLAVACLDQKAASTARQMVVFVTRRDLFLKRSKRILELETQNIIRNSPKERQKNRIRQRELYYGKVIPFLYARFFGIVGLIRMILVNIIGLFRPVFYQVSENDIRVVVHKTCALAAQTFMLAMANEGYDTCPMEGFDSRRVKRILQLPYGAEINMVVSCGMRDDQGVWGERIRIPFNEVYKEI